MACSCSFSVCKSARPSSPSERDCPQMARHLDATDFVAQSRQRVRRLRNLVAQTAAAAPLNLAAFVAPLTHLQKACERAHARQMYESESEIEQAHIGNLVVVVARETTLTAQQQDCRESSQADDGDYAAATPQATSDKTLRPASSKSRSRNH